MGSHFHQGGVIYALGRNDWGSHFPGGVIRDFDTGSRSSPPIIVWQSAKCKMAESKEYSTIVNCEGKLKIALKDDREIALFLRQNGILKKELYDNINEPKSMLSATDKVVKLVTAIRDSVELDSASYHLFVDHMRLNPRVYGTIAGILDKEYNRTSVSLAASINPPSGSHRFYVDS